MPTEDDPASPADLGILENPNDQPISKPLLHGLLLSETLTHLLVQLSGDQSEFNQFNRRGKPHMYS